MKANEILKIYGTDFRRMTKELLKAADAGKLVREKESLLGRKARIAIKPNLVTPSPAEFGATTHPEIVAGIIEYLHETGFTDITIMEGSWVGDKTARAFDICGYNTLSEKYKVGLIDTQKEKTVITDCAGMDIGICSCAKEADFLINVPVLKGHCQTHMTCALKNMKGLISDAEKRRFHREGLHKPIAHLNTGIHQDLIIIDHICGDPDFEEGGNPLVRNCIMLAVDPVLTDAYACSVLDCDVETVPYVKLAHGLGVGSMDLDDMILTEIKETGSDRNCFKEQAAQKENEHTRRLLDVKYSVEDSDSCSACYGMLTEALYRLREEGLYEKLEKKLAEKEERLCIGQGWKNRSGHYGIGSCTSGFTCSIAGCPPDAETIYEALKKLI